MSTLLITGGGGFVMGHLARQWVEADTQNRAIVLDAAPLDVSAAAFLSNPRIQFIQGDVTDRATWNRLPAPHDITYLAHAAAVTSINRHVVQSGLRGAVPALGVNIMGVAEALAFADQLPGLRRFVNLSSGSVYANHGRQAPGQPLPEDGNVAPDGWYAVSKYAGELLVSEAAVGGLPAVSVRLSGVFGPMDRTTPARAVDCVPKRMAHAARDGRTLRLAGLNAVGDWIHAGDVASGVMALLECAAPRHPVYNIAAGQVTTLAELAQLVPNLNWHESGPQEADIIADETRTGGRWGAYDISRMVADTGWRPRALGDAVLDYANWLKQHPF